MNAGDAERGRGLLVLADGAQAAFAAGAVAELARGGAGWTHGAGGGLGAQVAVLAVLGEAAEAERRWLRGAELGCPLLRSRLGTLRERMGDTPGALVLADPWTLPGWLDRDALTEHLAPESAGVPARLRDAGVTFAVAVEDVVSGSVRWAELSRLDPAEAGTLLRAAATFPCGWGPECREGEGGDRRLWGGVGAAVRCGAPWPPRGGPWEWDVVCGFPVPAAPRPALGDSLLELVQRREEAHASAAVANWTEDAAAGRFALVAPTAVGYLEWAARDTADLGVEYPLPWERNPELVGGMLAYGTSAVAARRGQTGE